MDDVIDKFRGKYAFLSNMSSSKFIVDGIKYNSVENFFQAQKTLDPEERKRIAGMSPVEAKRAGRKVSLRKDWNDIRLEIMKTGLRMKFSDPFLRKLLLNTGSSMLIEGNNYGDRFWGKVNDIGSNHLGELLMSVRADISS
jgi:ribA/ribD-fused uncharacterized protein